MTVPEYISTALSHGAKGYILKDVPDRRDQASHRCRDAGRAVPLHRVPAARWSPRTATAHARRLTGREQTILLELAQGKSNKEVALALDISVRTVETHRKNIKRKLGISSTAGLTRYALEHGVLQGTSPGFYAHPQRETRCPGPTEAEMCRTAH